MLTFHTPALISNRRPPGQAATTAGLASSVKLGCWVLLIGCLASNPLGAQSPAEFELIDGQTFSGSIAAIDETGQVHGAELPDNLRLDQLSRIRTESGITQQPVDYLVELVGGSRLRAQQVLKEGEHYQIDTETVTLSLGAESIRSIVWSAHVGSQLLQRLLAEPDSRDDRVIALAGDAEQSVAGLVESLDEQRVRIRFRGELRTISRERLAAIVLADLQQNLPPGTIGELTLVDGSFLVGAVGELADGRLSLHLPGSVDASVPWDQVVELSIRSDRVRYLAEIQPARVEQRAWVAPEFTWQANRNVFGEPLTLFDPQRGEFQEFTRGLGTHAYCRLEFELEPNAFTRFVAQVGLDQRAQHRGDCLVSVLGDGRELWSARVQGRQAPQRVDVDIRDIRRLTLLVEPGEHLDMADHVNWVDARLLDIN